MSLQLTIHFPCVKKWSFYLQCIFLFCVAQKKLSHKCLEQHEMIIFPTFPQLSYFFIFLCLEHEQNFWMLDTNSQHVSLENSDSFNTKKPDGESLDMRSLNFSCLTWKPKCTINTYLHCWVFGHPHNFVYILGLRRLNGENQWILPEWWVVSAACG